MLMQPIRAIKKCMCPIVNLLSTCRTHGANCNKFTNHFQTNNMSSIYSRFLLCLQSRDLYNCNSMSRNCNSHSRLVFHIPHCRCHSTFHCQASINLRKFVFCQFTLAVSSQTLLITVS